MARRSPTQAGAELIDMEFVQFHPTGMVWPPGVRGLLVTEAVRGEGGILRNADGERFMWTYLPEERRAEYAATDEEAARWVTALSQGKETDARRPPELSTRDNVARAIYTEVKEGRGSPHGGVFLDISYLPADHVRRKLPVDVRAVQGARRRRHHGRTDGGRSDDPLRDGRDPGRGGDRRDHRARACSRPARSPAGCTARIAWAATRCRTCSCSGPGPGRPPRPMPRPQAVEPYVDPFQVDEATRDLEAPLERTEGEDPYAIQRDLQVDDAEPGRDLPRRSGPDRGDPPDWPTFARDSTTSGHRRAASTTPAGTWCSSSTNLLTVSEAIARSARQRTESRGAHSRLDFPATDDAPLGLGQQRRVPCADGAMAVGTTPLPAMHGELRDLLGGDH